LRQIAAAAGKQAAQFCASHPDVEPVVHRVPRHPHQRGEGPSFLAVVVVSGVALAVFFVLAFVVLCTSGSELLPGAHQTAPLHSTLRVDRLSRAV
jgi:hypothetical protein